MEIIVVSRRTISTLWFAFFLAIIVYHGIIFARPWESEVGAALVPAAIGYILLFMGILSLLVVVNLDLFMLSRPRTIRISASQLPRAPLRRARRKSLPLQKQRGSRYASSSSAHLPRPRASTRSCWPCLAATC